MCQGRERMYRIIITLIATLSLTVQANIVDDRLRNIAPVIKQIEAGKKIDPIRVDLKNYVYILGIKTLRKKLKNHMLIVLSNGKTLKPVNGVLPTKVSMPFFELLRMYQQAYASNKKATINFLKKNTKPIAIDINDVVYKHSVLTPFSQSSLQKMIKGLKLKSLSPEMHAVTLLEMYFAIGGKVSNPKNSKLYAYKKNKGLCFLLPPEESICISDPLVSKGIKKALSANVGLGIYKSKSDFDKNTTWRVVY